MNTQKNWGALLGSKDHMARRHTGKEGTDHQFCKIMVFQPMTITER